MQSVQNIYSRYLLKEDQKETVRMKHKYFDIGGTPDPKFTLPLPFSSRLSLLKPVFFHEMFGLDSSFLLFFFVRKSVLLDHFHGCQHLVLMGKVKIVLWLSIYLFRCVSGESSALFLSFFRWAVHHIRGF